MKKKLAIRGHSTHGKEVIELLEMLGGINDRGYIGTNTWKDEYYTLDNGYIRVYDWSDDIKFILEEFLEKYPYRVGDKAVYIDDNDIVVISEIEWDDTVGDIFYNVKRIDEDDCFLCHPEVLKPYKETNMKDKEDKLFDSIIWHLRNSVNNGKQNLSGGECEDYFREVVKKNNENKMKNVLAELLEHIKTTPKEDLEREFEEIAEWSNVGPTVEEFRTFCECVNKKPKYPTTYKECCDILGFKNRNKTEQQFLNSCDLYDFELMTKLSMLKVCRDAYWKIAGEELELGKPWKPKFGKYIHYSINFYLYEDSFVLHKGEYNSSDNRILVFPTEEMRDAFYENFKVLIEQCKELL